MEYSYIDNITLKKIVKYDAVSGVFIWKNVKNRPIKSGKIAGNIKKNGYVRIEILGKSYQAHRLAWVYHYGVNPLSHIDHIDKNPSNNSIINLRLTTRSDNIRNSRKQKRNICGVTGVLFDVSGNRYRAQIGISGKCVKLGSFKTLREAVAARYSAEIKNGFFRTLQTTSAKEFLFP